MFVLFLRLIGKPYRFLLLIRITISAMITANAAIPAATSGRSGVESPVSTEIAVTTWNVMDFVTTVPSALQEEPLYTSFAKETVSV